MIHCPILDSIWLTRILRATKESNMRCQQYIRRRLTLTVPSLCCTVHCTLKWANSTTWVTKYQINSLSDNS